MFIQRETLDQDRLYQKVSEILNNQDTFRLDPHSYLRFQPSPSSSTLTLTLTLRIQARMTVMEIVILILGKSDYSFK